MTEETALIVRPRVLPTTAQFAIEQQMAWKLRNARGFLPNHFMVGDENERAAKILAAIEYARAVGIEPMIALQNTQVIDGKVGASALLIGALLRKAGYAITDDTNDARSIVTVSKNGIAAKGEFSMQDAQRAKLIKDGSGWQKYPRDMMYARALTQAARRGAQDAVLGMAYTADELGGVEEEIAGVPVLTGEVIDQAPGVSEATAVSPPPTAAIQPTPPAPPEGAEAATAPANPAQPPSAEVNTGAEGMVAPTPAPAPPVGVATSLGGASVQRRMGRSIGPAPVRKNVVTVEQGAEKPATAPKADSEVGNLDQPRVAAAAVEAFVASQEKAQASHSPALTDEPDLAPAPEPEDPGKAVYLNQLRGDLRVQTAELVRVNVLLDNVKRGLESKEPNEVPPATPSEASDQALAQRINADFPGRKLENLHQEALEGLLERFSANLAKKRSVLKERGITEE
jgi:hypothetical protein